jgi:mannan endo-1,4-beta-mannosidase
MSLLLRVAIEKGLKTPQSPTARRRRFVAWGVVRVIACVALLGIAGLSAQAAQPVNPKLSPEARALFVYLESIYGKKTLVGQNKFWEAKRAFEASGKWPAMVSSDLSGWNKQRWNDQYKRTIQNAVDESKTWWHERGGIVSFEWHWANPMSSEGTFEATRPKFEPTIDVGRVVTPGTPEHAAAMDDLKRHADYLEQLRDAKVPVLWRPLHEIEGGWFWWSDVKTPENTAKLWRMMHDYFTNERKLDNLIWVYSSALKAGDHGKDVEMIDYRKRFYPGAQYVDIAGIDIYTNTWFGWADYRESAFPKAFEIAGQVAPGKMLALCECQGLPNPDMIAKEGPAWLYCLPWYVGSKDDWNPPAWVKQVYGHEQYITLDELPKLKPAQP